MSRNLIWQSSKSSDKTSSEPSESSPDWGTWIFWGFFLLIFFSGFFSSGSGGGDGGGG